MGLNNDIDIMVSGMSGREFAERVVKYLKEVKSEPAKNVGVIEARPEQSKHLETAVLNIYGNSVDFVSPRAEVYTPDSRIPQTKPASPEEDASRRDFNFNSLFYNLDTGEVEDFTGKGLEDLKSKTVRTPIDPKITFMDDPLRILRAIRFATRFGFELDPELINAAKDPEVQDSLHKKISRERIEAEVRKMLSGPDPVKAMRIVKDLNLLSVVFQLPEKFEPWDMDQKSPHHDFNVWEHTMQALTNIQEIIKGRNLSDADKFIVNMAALMHDVGKLDPTIPKTKQLADKIIIVYHGHEEASMRAAEYILRRLPGIKVEEIEKIKKLIDGARRVNPDRRDTSEVYNRSRKTLGKFVREMGDLWEHAIDLGFADSAGHKINEFSAHPKTYYETMKKQIIDFNPAAIQSMKPLLNGNELMTLFGRKGGTWIGDLIKELIDWQLENAQATKQDAEQFVKKVYLEKELDKKANISKRSLYDIMAAKVDENSEKIKLIDQDDNWYEDDKGKYTVSRLIELSSALPTIKVSILELMKNTDNHQGLEELAIFSTTNILEHNRVHDSDNSFPILIKEDGTIIDGFHRVLKAILSGTNILPAKKIPLDMLAQSSFEDDADDTESNKYNREKNDPKWNEILIDKDGTKLTRKEIRDHYIKNADKILKEIKDKPIMIYIGTEKNKNILKRKHNDKPIVITNADPDKSGKPDNLQFWADRRLLSLHLVMGNKTKLGWVDVDLHGDFSPDKAKDYAKKVALEIKKEFGVSASLWNSGGTGIHVEFELKNEIEIDKLREQLKTMLDRLNESFDNITTGIVQGNGLRSDISTLHEKGNLRARYSLGETYGKKKTPATLSSRE